MYIINESEFDLAYQIMKTSFPKSELRTYAKMKKYFEEGLLILYGIKDNEKLTGVIMCWECTTFVFLENFAVSESERGKGLGSIILDDIQKQYDDRLIILEVESPYDEMSHRRINFYKRNGFNLNEFGYLQPQISDEINEIPLLIMSAPRAIDHNEFKRIKVELFADVYMQKNENWKD